MEKEDKIGFIIFVAMCCAIAATFWLLTYEWVSAPTESVQVEEETEQLNYQFDPCGLDTVICDYERTGQERNSSADSEPFGRNIHQDQQTTGGIKQPSDRIGGAVTVTAYTSYANQTDSSPCIAADGSNICDRYAGGEKICATNDHPMGSQLLVDGYGVCTVADRMNSRYTGTGRVDIYLGYDTAAAFEWGVKKVNINHK